MPEYVVKTLEDRARAAEHIIERAVAAGVTVDSGNVIDLLADNLPGLGIHTLRVALADSTYRGRWPSAERQRI